MPFRLVSHVTNADMNLLGDKGPNYSRELIVHGPTVSNCLPGVKQRDRKMCIIECVCVYCICL